MASGHVTPHTVLCHHTRCTDNARTVKLRDSVIMALLNCFHMFRTLASLILDWKNRVFFSLERRACLIYAQYIIIADIDDVELSVRDSSFKKEISVITYLCCSKPVGLSFFCGKYKKMFQESIHTIQW